MNTIFLHDLGLSEYRKTWSFQEKLFYEVIQKKLQNRNLPPDQQTVIENHFIFCEHPPVITLGSGGDENNLLLSKSMLKKQGIDFVRTNRGGDITYHGPGQIVGYPILDLDQWTTDIHQYMRMLEEVIIRTLAAYHITAGRIKDATGVWIDTDKPGKTRKICAMGVRTSRWVTMHGFALNVNTNLTHFNYIIPCGISDKQVTSMQQELNKTIDINDVKRLILKHFSSIFSSQFITADKQGVS
jgi:lipoyl(octanoyl) transferase